MTKEYQDFLAHYGVKGQKKGTRRYQNPDGSLTPEGLQHYGASDKKQKEQNVIENNKTKDKPAIGSRTEEKTAEAQKKTFWSKTVDRATANSVWTSAAAGASFLVSKILSSPKITSTRLKTVKHFSKALSRSMFFSAAINVPIAAIGQGVRAIKRGSEKK